MEFRRCYAFLIQLVFVSSSLSAGTLLFGVDPFTNQYFQVDPSDGQFLSTQTTTLSGFTVTGLNSITLDPATGVFYVIVKTGSGRRLGTLDPTTGVIVDRGSLGDNFSSLTFDSTGQLYGVTGDGASVPETLYSIDKSTAGKTVIQALGNGADGEVIAFNPITGSIFHWSLGIFESINLTTHAVTNITQSGTFNSEVFGAVWSPSAQAFLVSDIGSTLKTQTASGLAASIGTATEDYRGLALQETSSTPEPGAICLLMTGFGALIGLRKRSTRGLSPSRTRLRGTSEPSKPRRWL